MLNRSRVIEPAVYASVAVALLLIMIVLIILMLLIGIYKG